VSEPLDAVETDPERESPVDAAPASGSGDGVEKHALVVTEEPPEDPRSDVERERDEYLDALRRLQADFENYKKRVDRQFEELSARGATSLVLRLLPVLDTLDLAEEHLLADDADANSTEETRALVQARALLLDTLAKDGLERVGTAGEPFDPTVHDAVAHTDGDGEGGPVVDAVLRAGYRWRGQVLRPAMVKVKG
jgi:molecular chaperone GrpE